MTRKIGVEILGDSSSLERAFKKSSRDADKFNRHIKTADKHESIFSGIGKAASFATGALGIGGLGEAVKASFEEMNDAQKVSAQTAAAIKSTGGAANVTAGHVDDLATSLLNVSGVDDEVIKGGENMLLAFTNVRNEAGKGNDVFDQATKSALDLSTRLGINMPQAAKLVGKALNDPIKGLTSLQRVGVKFTDGQKAQVKAMVKSGDTMGAQKVILKALQDRFGGAAKAAGDTMSGKLNKLKETAKNLGGQIATQLAPAITHVITKITNWISKSENQKKVMNTVKQAIGALRTAVRILRGAFEFLSKIVGGNKHMFELLIGAFAAWKVMNTVNKFAQVAGSIGNVTKMLGGGGGEAGLIAAAGVAAFTLTTMALNATGLDGVLKGLGGTIHDVAADLGLIHDPMAQFAGKAIPGQSMATQVRALTAKGFSPAQIVAMHPTWARRDVEVLGGYRANPTINVGTMHVNGVQTPAELYSQAKVRALTRRG